MTRFTGVSKEESRSMESMDRLNQGRKKNKISQIAHIWPEEGMVDGIFYCFRVPQLAEKGARSL